MSCKLWAGVIVGEMPRLGGAVIMVVWGFLGNVYYGAVCGFGDFKSLWW